MALRRIQHPVSDEMFSVTKGDRTLSNLLPVLGPPQSPLDFNVEDRLSHEKWPVEKLFEGKQIYLENALSTMVKRTHNPFVTDLIMPLTYYDGISFVWSKWHGNRTLAAQTPVGAPPERVTQQRTKFRSTMNRYELGFVVHAETLDNPEGEFALALDLATVGVAFGDTFEQLGLTALLQRKNYHRERLRKFHEQYSNAAELFAWEKLFWDIIRKDPSGRGFYTLAEEVKKAQRTIISSDVIVPEGFKSLLARGPANEDYYIYGDGARGNVVLGADNIGRNVATGLRIHVVREIEIDKDGMQVRPMHRVKTIGDHFRLEDYLSDCKPEDYRSCSRTIKVFDMSETRGVFKPVDFLYALNHTERFQNDGKVGRLVPKHGDLARNVASKAMAAHLTLKDGFADMFLYKSDDNTEYKVVDVLGQMEEVAMPYEAVRATAQTFALRLVESLGAGIRDNLQKGRDLINRIYNKTLTEDDFNNLTKTASNAGGVVNGVLSGNSYGAHNLDAYDVSNVRQGGFLPAGAGHVAGVFSMADVSNEKVREAIGNENIKVAQNFKSAVTALHSAASSMFSESHIAFNPASTPNHFKSSFAEASQAGQKANSIIAFAQNLIDANKAPLYFTGAAANDASNIDLAKGVLGNVEGATADEQQVLQAVRASIADTASPDTRAKFKNAETLAEFRSQYEQSPFASAYSRLLAQRASDPTEASELRKNKSFTQFATRHLTDLLGSGSITSVGSVMNGVVDAVKSGRAMTASSIEEQLQKWASAASAGSSSRGIASLASLPASGSVLTRFTVSPSAMAEAVTKNVAGSANFALASPTDITRTINLQNQFEVSNAEAVSTASLNTLFAHSNARPFNASNNNVDFAMSGADPDLNTYVDTYVNVVGAGNIDQNTNLKVKWAKAVSERDTLVQLGALLLLLAPASRETFEKLYHNDVRVPVAILGERPLRRYEAASCIFAAGGGELGEIAWSKFDVHLSSNAMTKEFEGNASIWACAIVKNEERYFLAEDVLVTGYFGGESLRPFTRESFKPEQLDNESASVFYFLVPIGSLRGPESVQKTHDIRGFYTPDLIEQRLTPSARGLVTDRPHYPSALYYSQVYAFNRLQTLSMEDSDLFKVDGRHDNTITHQTMQWLWHPQTGKHSEAIMNTDHFGQNIYEGHGDLRTMGAAMHYKEMNYNFSPTD